MAGIPAGMRQKLAGNIRAATQNSGEFGDRGFPVQRGW
jgi:hypothetical protein